MKTIVSPSILSADFLNLGRDIDMVNQSEAEWLHFDVMDGVFVPNISFGFPVLAAVRKTCRKMLDVHYMIIHPEQYIERTAQMGAMMMTVHAETCPQLLDTINKIHNANMKAGVAINPATPISAVEEVLDAADMILVMSVNPGFGGQGFIENTYEKVATLRNMIDQRGLNTLIEVDGGVNAITAPKLVEAGVNVLVSGSYIFHAADPLRIISELHEL